MTSMAKIQRLAQLRTQRVKRAQIRLLQATTQFTRATGTMMDTLNAVRNHDVEEASLEAAILQRDNATGHGYVNPVQMHERAEFSNDKRAELLVDVARSAQDVEAALSLRNEINREWNGYRRAEQKWDGILMRLSAQDRMRAEIAMQDEDEDARACNPGNDGGRI